MPNWKKVLVSGSDAALNSINVTTTIVAPSITGSLFGTASWANNAVTASFFSGSIANAVSASYALTASYATNIQVSGAINNVQVINFATGSDQPVAEGRLGWDDGYGTLNLGLKGGNVNLEIGEELFIRVFNAEATTLTKGTVVYISGSQGNRVAVKRASASAELGSANTLGFVAEQILSGAEGFVQTEGPLDGLNTSGLTAGGLVFLSSSAGLYTQTPPQAPLHSVRLGYVERVHNTVGSIYVKIDNGYEIDELHDVLVTNPTNGDLLVRSESLWLNTKQLTGSYGLTGSLNATLGFTGSLLGTASWSSNSISASFAATSSNVLGGTTNYIPVWRGSTSLSSSIIYENDLKIGIGTTGPGSRLEVDSFSLGNSVAGFNAPSNGGVLSFKTSGTDRANLFWRYTIDQGTGGNYLLLSNNENGGNLALQTRTSGGVLNSNALVIDSTSNIGLGTTSPTAKLHVIGNTLVSGSLTVTGSVTAPSFVGTASWASNAVTASYILNAVSSSYALSASQAQNAVSASFASTSSNIQGGATGYITLWDTNTRLSSSVVYQSGGNVGIGTTSPSAKLDINGNAIVSGTLTIALSNAIELQVASTGVKIGNTIADSHNVTGSLNTSGSMTLLGTFTQTPFKSIVIPSLAASATQAREFEILRGITDYNDWSPTGVVEIEVHEQQYGRGLKKTYAFSYGYFDSAEFKLVEMIGASTYNNFQLRMGSKTLISGDVYYYPIYAQVKYYASIDILIKTRRPITTNPVSTTNGDLYVNTAPTASNISDFTADSIVTLSNAASGVDITGSFGVSGTATVQNLAVNGTNATFNTTNTTINSSNVIVGNDTADLVGIAGNTMYFPGSGRVGIGTTVPSYKTHIVDSNNTTPFGISVGSNATYLFTGNSTSGYTTTFNINDTGLYIGHNSSARSLNLQTNSTDRLTILGGGNIGIGQTNPQRLLHIQSANGTASQIQLGQTSQRDYYIGIPASQTYFDIYDASAGASRLAITSGGNVGIGTTSPSAPFEVYTTGDPTAFFRAAGDFNVGFKGSTLGNTQLFSIRNNNTTSVHLNTQNSARLALGVSTTSGSGTVLEHLTINSSGYVGINTTSPTAKLTVSGEGNGAILLGNTGFGSNYAGMSLNGTLNSTNYSLLGSTTDLSLYINRPTGGTIRFREANADQVAIVSSGAVGIGTITPNAKLDVSGNAIITGSLTIGTSSLGSTENTLVVGPSPSGGTGEGGQILLQATGGTYTSASMLDNYQNRFRILRGTNASSDAEYFNLSLHSGQLGFSKYTGSGAFPGTAVANLAVDSGGNVITVATGSGGGSVTINNNTDNYLITATGTANTLNGEANLQFDGSVLTVTGGLTVTTGSNIELQVTNAGVKIGNVVTDSHNVTGSLNIQTGSFMTLAHTSSGVIRLQDASVWVNASNYVYPQIRLRDYQTGMTLVNNDEVHIVNNATATAGFKLSAGIPKMTLDSSAWLQWSTAATNGFTHDVILKRESASTLAITGSVKVNSGVTGSLLGTSSWAVSASWAPAGSAPTSVTFNRVTGSYTFALTDAGKTVEVSASAAGTYNLTVPPASTTNFADGAFIDVILYGTGSIQFVTGSGVTFRSANSWTKLGTRYGAVTIINIAGDEWYLIGNLNA